MDRRKQARAAVAGALAAAAYLGGSKLAEARPVRTGTLLVLTATAMAGLITARNTSKTVETEARLNNFLANGGHIRGGLKVWGDHHVTGKHTVGNGLEVLAGDAIHWGDTNHHGETQHNGHAIRGITEMYDNGGDFGLHGGSLYTNGNDIFLNGGKIYAGNARSGTQWP